MSPSTVAVDWVEPGGRDQHREEVAGSFQETFGAPPDGVWSAPGRVNLMGEHLDYNGGPVLPFAIDHRTMVAVAARSDDRIRLRSRQHDQGWEGSATSVRPDDVEPWCRYPVGVHWAMHEAADVPVGFDALVDGRVPSGSGLSSSAALTCAVALALHDLASGSRNREVDAEDVRRTLAQACVRAENEFAGAPTGGMDQAVVLRATQGHALLLDCRDFGAEHVRLPDGAQLLVVDTRTQHSLTDGRYGGRREACERAVDMLGVARLTDISSTDLDAVLGRLPDEELRGVVRHIVTETERVHDAVAALRARSWRTLGPILRASHRSMRDDFGISTPELDLVVDSAVQAGAIGARMTGGGFGGSAVVVCPDGARADIAAGISRAFDRDGHAPPGMLAVQATASAERVTAPSSHPSRPSPGRPPGG
ncbi:MAG: galactokinase [Ornithinimicrobium sp.]